jgi:hypothetical protein
MEKSIRYRSFFVLCTSQFLFSQGHMLLLLSLLARLYCWVLVQGCADMPIRLDRVLLDKVTDDMGFCASRMDLTLFLNWAC